MHVVSALTLAYPLAMPWGGRTKDDLVSRAQRGDRAAMNDLVRQHLPAVRRHVARLVPPGVDVDDLVQIAMCEMLRSLPSFRGEAKLETWLYRITRRVVGRHRDRYAATSSEVEEPAASDDPERQAAARQSLARVSAVLARLTPEQREVFVAFEVDGLKLQEIAERMESSVPTTASRLRRARLEIFATLEEASP